MLSRKYLFSQFISYPGAMRSGADPTFLEQDLTGGFQSVFCGALGYTRGCQRDKECPLGRGGYVTKAAPFTSVLYIRII